MSSLPPNRRPRPSSGARRPDYSYAQRPGSRNKKDTRMLILGLVFLVLLISSVTVGMIIFKTMPISTITGASRSNNQENVNIPQGSEYTRPLLHDNDPQSKPWDGKSRVTILVMGLDSRDTGETASRTDSMILFSMDPATKTAGMLSIPRDTWVTIPGYGEDKINTAYFKGELDQIDGAGPGLAVSTVENFLGLPINYFAQIDFESFAKFIDEIGGVDIKVREEMVIDPVGVNNTIFLKPGTQTFNGAQALAYARARSTAHGDFDRADRQQQVILAVRDNVLNYYSLPKLIIKAPAIYNDIASGVRTNMTLQDVVRLSLMVQEINMDNIHRGVLNEPDQLTQSMSWEGEYILLPDMPAVLALRNEVFGSLPETSTSTASNLISTPAQAADAPVAEVPVPVQEEPVSVPESINLPTEEPAITLSPQDSAKAEKAQIIIYNGTAVVGLAARTHEYLMLKGMRVIKEANADNKLDYTEIRVSSNYPATVNYLADLLKVPASRIFSQNADPDNPADIVIILGTDWANNNDMP